MFNTSYYQPNVNILELESINLDLDELSDLKSKIENNMIEKIHCELSIISRKYNNEDYSKKRISTDLFGFGTRESAISEQKKKMDEFLHDLVDKKILNNFRVDTDTYNYGNLPMIMIRLSLDGLKYFDISMYLYI